MGDINKPDDYYVVRCTECGVTNRITMIPHRRDDLITGILFACEKCAPKLFGGFVKISGTEEREEGE